MEVIHCQCCGMLMEDSEKYGTNADGSKTDEYCCYCWIDGSFADWCKDISLDEMIEENIRFVLEANAAVTIDEAREMLRQSMPKQKRWAALS